MIKSSAIDFMIPRRGPVFCTNALKYLARLRSALPNRLLSRRHGGKSFFDAVVSPVSQMNDKKPTVGLSAFTLYQSVFLKVVDHHCNIAAASENFLPDFSLGSSRFARSYEKWSGANCG
jgi:hypothetical protein